MPVSTTEIQSIMNAEKDRLLPKFTDAIDSFCRSNLATEYQFVFSVDTDNDHDGVDVTLHIVNSSEVLRLSSEYVWESGMMSFFVNTLSRLYQEAGWSVVANHDFALEVVFRLSFALRDATA